MHGIVDLFPMSTPVEQIKARLSITDVVGSYIKLEKAGSSYKALCPFHKEKSPSFNVSPTRDAYYCFGCNRGGDIFTFVEEIEGLPFTDTLRLLAERAGVTLEKTSREDTTERDRLLDIMEAATLFYQKNLVSHPEALQYLRDRGLKQETMKDFRLGFAPQSWDAVRDHLREKGFTASEIERAGMTKPGEKGQYDRFRGRIMFPIRDGQGRVVAFTGRIFGHQTTPDGSEPAKYLNSPEGPLYDKSSLLFNFDQARQHIRKQNFVIIVEGQMDCLMSYQAGTTNVVAVSGTALTERHLTLVKRLTDNVVFAFDADDAGLAATRRAFTVALRVGLGVRVAAMPEGKDPADVVMKDPDLWMKAIADSSHIIDFSLNALEKRGYDARHYREAVEKEVLPLVLSMPSKIEEAHFIMEIARRLGIAEQAVWEEVKRQASRLPREELPPLLSRERDGVRGSDSGDSLQTSDYGLQPTSRSLRRLTEEAVWGILFWQETHAEPSLDPAEHKGRYRTLMDHYGVPHITIDPDEERTLAIKAENTYTNEPQLKDTVDEMLDTLEGEVLKEKQEELWRRLADAERRGAKDEMDDFTKQYQAITPRRIDLENRKTKRNSPS